MPTPHFDFLDLALFVRIAQTGSMTAGAQLAQMSLSAASSRMRSLEEELGTRLLYRENNGVSLTSAGERLLAHARRVLQLTDRLGGDLCAFSSRVLSSVAVHANPAAVAEFLTDALRSFLAANPQVDIELEERLDADIVAAVNKGTADIGIVSDPVRSDGLHQIPCHDSRLVLAVRADHRLAGAGRVAFADTLDEDHVTLDDGSSLHSLLRNAAAGLDQPLPVRIQVSSLGSVCTMVEAGIGVAVLPSGAAAKYARQMRIELVELADAWAEVNLRVIVRASHALPAPAKELMDHLLKHRAAR
jgi:DNA-binding transcriptional LysR family regulator